MTEVTPDTRPLIEAAISAIQAGQPDVGRVLLEEVLAHDERNELAWWWLSAVAGSDEERQVCFANVLAINPNNQAARRGLPPTQLSAPSRRTPLRWVLAGLIGLTFLCVGLAGLGLAGQRLYSAGRAVALPPTPTARPDSGPLARPTPPVRYAGWTNFTNGNEILDLHLQGETLWAATGGGLVRWDTAEHSYLKYTSEHGLPGNRIELVGTDADGQLWIRAEAGGLYLGDGQSWRRPPGFDDPRLSLPKVFLRDSRGNVWVGNTALARSDGQGWAWFEGLLPDTARGTNTAHSIFEDSQGNIWVGADQILLRYDGQGWQSWATPAGLGEVSVLAIAQESTGALLLGTRAGILRFDPENPAGPAWGTFETTDGLPGEDVFLLFVDSAGRIWAGVRYSISQGGLETSTMGLMVYAGDRWRAAPGLEDHQVVDMVEDGAGTLWVGTKTGLFRFDGAGWQAWQTQDGLAGNVVSSMAQDQTGRLWFGTWAGVSTFDPEVAPSGAAPGNASGGEPGWQTIPGTGGDSLIEPQVFVDRNGHVWVSSRESNVTWFDGQRWHELSQADVASGDLNRVQTIFQANDGQMWFVSLNRQVTAYDGQAWRAIPELESVTAFNEPKQFIRDTNGDIWALSSHQLWRYDGQAWETSPIPSDHNGGRLTLGPDGALWLTTNPDSVSTLWRYDGSAWQPMTPPPGGPEISGGWLFFDRAGGMWVSARDGLYRYHGNRWERFGPADSGLASTFVKGIREDNQGNLWIATTGGLSRLALDEVK
jgi:ligand-binding sensor domain-containing protein